MNRYGPAREERTPTRGPGRPLGARDRRGHAHRVIPAALDARRLALAVGIAGRLTKLMAESDVGATELAAALGASEDTVSSWLAGRSTPSLWSLLAIASGLRCSLVDLLPDDAHLP